MVIFWRAAEGPEQLNPDSTPDISKESLEPDRRRIRQSKWKAADPLGLVSACQCAMPLTNAAGTEEAAADDRSKWDADEQQPTNRARLRAGQLHRV
jgi:hypothetical protein